MKNEWYKIVAGMAMGLACCMARGAPPSIPGVPEMEAYGVLATQLVSYLVTADTNSTWTIVPDLFRVHVDLTKALEMAAYRLMAASQSDVSSGTLEDYMNLTDTMVKNANATRGDSLNQLIAWLDSTNSEDLAQTQVDVANSISNDTALAQAMTPALNNIESLTLPATLFADVGTGENVGTGQTVRIEVGVINAGDETAQNAKIVYSKDPILGGGKQEVSIGSITGRGEVVHNFFVTVGDTTGKTAEVEITITASNAVSAYAPVCLPVAPGW